MKKPQFIVIGIAVLATLGIFFFGRTAAKKAVVNTANTEQHSPDDGHDHSNSMPGSTILFDSVLSFSKTKIKPEQKSAIEKIESELSQVSDNQKKVMLMKQLATYWKDSIVNYLPYAWYTAEIAKLENSEKNLNFAAHLFLDGAMQQEDASYKTWMGLQAKDLFERSLKLNPDSDSTKVGLGATYLFGGVSEAPMEGLAKIKEVTDKDSTNEYALMTLASASVLSGQMDKAHERLTTVIKHHPNNVQALVMMGDLKERMGHKSEAAQFYKKVLPLVNRADLKKEIEARIKALQ